jgi:hypothetical protein
MHSLDIFQTERDNGTVKKNDRSDMRKEKVAERVVETTPSAALPS